jgi:AcrR family transcriptional regulator
MPTLVDLLWRREREPTRPGPGRRPRASVDEIVGAGIAVADRVGTLGFGLREVAKEVGVSVMSLYSHVATREELLALMVDECRRSMAARPSEGPWRERLEQVAAENLTLLEQHPWLAEWESEREVLGPGTLGKYERELGAVAALPLDDVTRDAVLTLVLDHVRASARALRQAGLERARESPEQWWEREGSRLAELDVAGRYPLASRVGTAAGTEQGAARDAVRAHHFGLQVILDGVEARVSRAGAAGRPAGR